MHSSSLKSYVTLKQATTKEYPLIQNMARFYVYDMSRSCGFTSEAWTCPADGLYFSNDFKRYFEEPTRIPFLIMVNEELAGFVLINKQGTKVQTDWNMGEFFILAKFQRKGVGTFVAEQLWDSYPGIWEISVIPENTAALSFWRKAALIYSSGLYNEELKEIADGKEQKARHILRFNTTARKQNSTSYEPLTVEWVASLSPELEQRMSQGLVSYETSNGIVVNHQRFSLQLANQQHAVYGVLNAYTAFAEIYVEDIWVDSAYRGQGYGRQLLHALEERFSGKGYNNINLVTSAFQAPEFYKKCGYQVEFIRQNRQNPQLSKIFFVKFFPDTEQTQGILLKDSQDYKD